MDDYFDRIDTDEDFYVYDDCLPLLDEEPVVAEPDYPIHSYDRHCEVCGGPCAYEGDVAQGFCEYHGYFNLDDEDGNCPNCLAIAADFCSSAYAGLDYINEHWE